MTARLPDCFLAPSGNPHPINPVRLRAVIRILSIALWLAIPQFAAAQQPVPNTDLALSDLVREIKIDLLQVAEAVEAQNLPTLEAAVLEAKTVMKVEGNGSISLWVVELGGGQHNEYVSTVTLTLKPPPPGSSSDIAAARLADVLREAILSGARAIQGAGQGNPPLIADKLEASIHFGIQRHADGKLSVKFPPLGVSVGGGASIDAVQTITVTYKRK